MNNRSILVLFDVGGVLLKLNYGSFIDDAAALSRIHSPTSFREAYIQSDLELRIVSGQISPQQYFQELEMLIQPRQPIDTSALQRLRLRCFTGPIDEIIALKRQVYEAGYAVGILSNMGNDAHETLAAMWPEIFSVFDDSFPAIYSYQVKSIKPRSGMYECITGFKKVVYIDDNLRYVKKGIEEYGWYGIWFTPYIDPSEAIRVKDSSKELLPEKKFYQADSIDNLQTTLRTLSVH